MEIIIGPYIISQRTSFSKIKVFDIDSGKDITDTSSSFAKMFEDYEIQSSEPEKYFDIENESFIGLNELNCKDLEYIFVPEKVTKLGDHSLSTATLPNIKGVSLPNSLKRIFGNAFWGCDSLLFVNIPDSVVSIGPFAFQNNTSLKDVRLPNTLKSLPRYMFDNCPALEKNNIARLNRKN